MISSHPINVLSEIKQTVILLCDSPNSKFLPKHTDCTQSVIIFFNNLFEHVNQHDPK